MSPRTLFISRLIGLYCIVVGLSMTQASVETVTALLQNSSMMLIVGTITLAAGLAVVLAHNIWSGGARGCGRSRRLDNAHQEPILFIPTA